MAARIVKRLTQLGPGSFDRRVAGMGTSCGILGGICCIGKAVAGRGSARHAAVCVGTYVMTLGLTMGIMALADWLWLGP